MSRQHALDCGGHLEQRNPETDNLIQFPPQLRVAPIESASALPLDHELVLIEHDGRMYDLAPLVGNFAGRTSGDR